MSIPPLSNLQQELLQLYAKNESEEDLLAIKRLLAKYFMSKAIKEADTIWEQKGYSQETIDNWLKENRTLHSEFEETKNYEIIHSIY